MLVMPHMNVLLSNVGEIDLFEIDDCFGIQCRATDDMIVSSMEYLRENIEYVDEELNDLDSTYIEIKHKDYWVNIFDFNALYMDSLLFDNEAQRGYVVVTYNEVHWDPIEIAYVGSWILSGLMLFFGSVLVIYNVKFHRTEYFQRQQSLSIRDSNAMPAPDGTSDGHKTFSAPDS